MSDRHVRAAGIALAAVALLGFWSGWASAAPPDDCASGGCRLTGAAIKVTIPLPQPGHFAGKFELVPLFDKGRPVLNNGHSFYALRNTISYRLADGTLLTAPAGMTTDLASIPQAVWGLMPPDGPWAEGATIHDDCFRTKGSFVWIWPGKPGVAPKTFVGLTGRPPLSRDECNEAFRQTMVTLGAPTWKRIAIFEAVHLFSASAWGH